MMETHNPIRRTQKAQKTYNSDVNAVKVPPHSTEAEQSVLGGLMLDNRAWDTIADRLQESDFYRHDHRLIYRVMSKLSEQSKPLDVLHI